MRPVASVVLVVAIMQHALCKIKPYQSLCSSIGCWSHSAKSSISQNRLTHFRCSSSDIARKRSAFVVQFGLYCLHLSYPGQGSTSFVPTHLPFQIPIPSYLHFIIVILLSAAGANIANVSLFPFRTSNAQSHNMYFRKSHPGFQVHT